MLRISTVVCEQRGTLASDIMGESLLLCVVLVKFGNSEGVAAHSFEYLQPSLLGAAACSLDCQVFNDTCYSSDKDAVMYKGGVGKVQEINEFAFEAGPSWM